MRKLTVMLLGLMLIAAACGDDNSSGASDSCEGIATAGIALFQDVLDEIDGLNPEEQAAVLTSDEEPPFLADLETKGLALEARADQIGCTDEQLLGLMSGKVGDLKADTTIGELFLQGIEESIASGDFLNE